MLQNREEHLHRTRQLKNESHCLTPAFSKYGTQSMEDMEEDIIYSEGEPFEGYLYPNNTWDSDDSMYEEDYSGRSGWIWLNWLRYFKLERCLLM